MSPRQDLSAPFLDAKLSEAPAHPRPGPASPTLASPPGPAGQDGAGVAPAAAAKSPSRRRQVLLAVLAVVLVVGGYFGFGWWTTGRFMVSTDDAYVGADVTILASKVSGYVATLEVRDNQGVEAGQVIARIDDVDYRLAVQAAADKLATQQSTVGRIGRQIEAAEAQVGQAEPLIAAAQADVVRSAADYERQTRLSQADYASKARLEQALADRDRAVATLKGAQAGLVAARANVDVLKAQRSEAERTASEYRTALAKAERDLSFTVIRSPVAGVVGNRAFDIGTYLQTGTRLAALVPLSSVHVDANFKETQLGRIQPGMKVEIEVDAFSGRVFPGIVESIAPASGSQFSLLPPENATGNFTKIVQRVPVRVSVDPEVARQGLLRPGLSVVARVDTRTGTTQTAAR